MCWCRLQPGFDERRREHGSVNPHITPITCIGFVCVELNGKGISIDKKGMQYCED